MSASARDPDARDADAPQADSASAQSPTSPGPAPAEPEQILRILSGLHAGASRTLSSREMLLIGSGEDCDIVLSDAGVARHHAMVLRHDDSWTLRAIDAPLGVAGHPLHPGDPMALPRAQRIELGDVGFAVAAEDDPAWMRLLPGSAPRPGAAKARPTGLRRPRVLAALATVAVFSLVSVAVFAALVSPRDASADPRRQVASLVREYHVVNHDITPNPDGTLVLTGTVRNIATLERIRQRVEADDIDAVLNLRTGEDIAADVREVLRAEQITANTRYLGNGRVEVSGKGVDAQTLLAVSHWRAMDAVNGLQQLVLPPGAARPAQTARADTQAAADEGDRVVAIIRGAHPHVLTANGRKYHVGSQLPDGGRLSVIGKRAWALVDGQIRPVKPQPAPATDDDLADDTLADDRATAKTTSDTNADAVAAGQSADGIEDSSDGPAETRVVAQSRNATQATAAERQ